MTRRVVVLGADGFVGRRLVAALATHGWAPVAAVRRSGATPGAERVQVDATDPAAVRRVLDDAHGVVNCVAGPAGTIVANAGALAGASRDFEGAVVHCSSMAVYGAATGTVDESAPLRGDTGAYAAAKVEAERLFAASRATRLRPGIIYGPGSPQWSVRIARWLADGRLGDLGAAGDGACNLVHVDDVVDAALAALRTPAARGSAINLGSPEPPTWNEYFLRYARALGAVPLRRIPRRRLRLEPVLAAPLQGLQLAARAVGLERPRLPAPMPRSLLATFAQDLRLDVGRAEQLLGLRWRPLDTGLRQAAADYRRHG